MAVDVVFKRSYELNFHLIELLIFIKIFLLFNLIIVVFLPDVPDVLISENNIVSTWFKLMNKREKSSKFSKLNLL